MAKRLALAIPAFGRSETVAKLLGEIVEDAYRADVDLYYSDDSPDDSVELVVREFASRFDNVHYRRNSPSLGHDKNILQTLLWPDADYVWLIGDTLRPKPGAMHHIMSFLHEQDFVFLSRQPGTGSDIPERSGDQARALIRSKLWNQTLTGATIYGPRVRAWLRDHALQATPNFPHLGIILEFASTQPVCVGWINQDMIEYAYKPGSYWSKKALDVFVDDWVNVVSSHPEIVDKDALQATLKSHSMNTNLFSLKFLLGLRSSGQLDAAALQRPFFMDVMHKSPRLVRTIMAMPRVAARALLLAATLPRPQFKR